MAHWRRGCLISGGIGFDSRRVDEVFGGAGRPEPSFASLASRERYPPPPPCSAAAARRSSTPLVSGRPGSDSQQWHQHVLAGGSGGRSTKPARVGSTPSEDTTFPPADPAPALRRLAWRFDSAREHALDADGSAPGLLSRHPSGSTPDERTAANAIRGGRAHNPMSLTGRTSPGCYRSLAKWERSRSIPGHEGVRLSRERQLPGCADWDGSGPTHRHSSVRFADPGPRTGSPTAEALVSEASK